MKEAIFSCDNCYHVEQLGLPCSTFLNINLVCNCGKGMRMIYRK
jgi:hypothetical protein